MKIEIELCDKEVKFLKQYDELYNKERRIDCTRDPIVLVQVRDDKVTADGFQDYTILVDTNNEYHELSLDESEIIKYLVEEMEVDHFEAESIASEAITGEMVESEDGLICLEKRYMKKSYKTVAYFLTREEAQRYVSYQRHNLNKPRVFTDYAGYGNNGDLQCLAETLRRIGSQLNNDEKHRCGVTNLEC